MNIYVKPANGRLGPYLLTSECKNYSLHFIYKIATTPQKLTFDLLINAENSLLLWIKNEIVEQENKYTTC